MSAGPKARAGLIALRCIAIALSLVAGLGAFWLFLQFGDADGLDALDIHIALAQLQHFLAHAVATHFGRGREDPQELVAEFEALAVVEGDFHETRTLV